MKPTECEACYSSILSEHNFCVACRDRNRDRTWSAVRAAELTGITYRQLDWWCRTDLVPPTATSPNGKGSRRRYAYRDLILLRTVHDLTLLGVTVQALRKVGLPDLLAGEILLLTPSSATILDRGPDPEVGWAGNPYAVVNLVTVRHFVDRQIRVHWHSDDPDVEWAIATDGLTVDRPGRMVDV